MSIRIKIQNIYIKVSCKVKEKNLFNFITFANEWTCNLKKGSNDVASSFVLYFKNYGGKKALLRSPYIPCACVLSFIITVFGDAEWNWTSDSKTIIACTLGFSFAGYSLMLGMSDGKFIQAIKGKFLDGEPSPLMVVASAFTHFFVVQCVTLVWAIVSSAMGAHCLYFVKFVGVFLLLYSVCVLFASALAALNFVSWYDQHPE